MQVLYYYLYCSGFRIFPVDTKQWNYVFGILKFVRSPDLLQM